MMKYLKNESGQVYAFEADGSQDAFISEELTGITSAEADMLRSPAPTQEQLWATHRLQAQAALDTCDMTALRCFKAGIEFPSAWKSYDAALRIIVSTPTGDASTALPSRPAYPSGS